jgi:exosortase A
MTAAVLLRGGVRRRSGWPAHLAALGLVWAAMLSLLHRDAAHLVSIWWTSSTFNHCLLIPPIIVWLVAQRLPELRRLDPALWTGGLGLVGLGALAWLAGEAGGIAFARHAGLVLMLQGGAVACLGRTVARGLAFPIFYALFLIPAGEELVPALQTLTARIAMALLGFTGVPAHLEGIFITTPAGYFEVAEACAGARFLFAMLAFGALVANVCFRAWPRRIAFLGASVLVPVLANGVRAWGTIYIAQLAGIEFAVGFDHVFYGWVFFGIVIALMLAAAWPFFDRPVDALWLEERLVRNAAGAAPGTGAMSAVAVAAIALCALPVVWMAATAPAPPRLAPAVFALPSVPGWHPVPAGRDWRPFFAGADRFAAARYRDRRGREVDLVIAVFDDQSQGRELVGFGQGVDPRWSWSGPAAAPPGGRADRIASRHMAREVVSFYRVGEVLTGSGTRVKLETVRIRLLGGPRRAVAVQVSAPAAPASGASPRAAIDDFLAAFGPVETVADRAAGED